MERNFVDRDGPPPKLPPVCSEDMPAEPTTDLEALNLCIVVLNRIQRDVRLRDVPPNRDVSTGRVDYPLSGFVSLALEGARKRVEQSVMDSLDKMADDILKTEPPRREFWEVLYDWWYGYRLRSVKRKVVDKVVAGIKAAFKDMDWNKNTFYITGQGVMTNDKGETRFYSANSVNEVVKRINKLCDRLLEK